MQTDEYKEEEFNHLFTQKINLENFEIAKVIGWGSYAKIYLVKKYNENDEV